MEEKATFVVDISHLQATFITLVALANIALIPLAWFFVGPLGLIVVMVLSSSYPMYKMMRPDEVMLKVSNNTCTFYRNQVEVTSCPDNQLEITFSKHYRFGYHFISFGLNDYRLARIHLRFPDGKRFAFTVTSWEPIFAPHYATVLFDFKSIRNLTWDASVNMASEMQVQRLIDYYNLNYLLTFKKD